MSEPSQIDQIAARLAHLEIENDTLRGELKWIKERLKSFQHITESRFEAAGLKADGWF